MTQVTVNGRTYSDDGSTARDMLNGGAKTFFLPLVSDTMVEIGGSKTNADNAAASAIQAASAAAALSGTSTTSLLVEASSKTLTTQTGKQFGVGTYLRLQRAADAAVFMIGRSTAYNTATGVLSVAVERATGSGTYSDWNIFVTGAPGVAGADATPAIRTRTITAIDTIQSSDMFRMLRLTGAFTLAAAALATLPVGFSVFVRNDGTGTVTIDPNGPELIDGAATRTVQPGEVLLIISSAGQFLTTVLHSGTGGWAHLQDRKSSGTQGGAVSNNSTREINTVLSNTIAGATLASNQVTLATPGTYEWSVETSIIPNAGEHRISLYNVTDSTEALSGVNGSLSSGTPGLLRGRVTITASKTFELREAVRGNSGSFNAGNPVTNGQSEVYLNCMIRRIA